MRGVHIALRRQAKLTARQVVSQLDRYQKAAPAKPSSTTVATDISEQLDFPELLALETLLAEQALAAYQDGVTAAADQISVAVALEDVHQQAQDYAEKRAAELVGKKKIGGRWVTNPNPKFAITESTRDMVRSEIVEGLEAGLPNAEIGTRIMQLGAFSSSRALMIARTETAFADVAGNMATYRESGVVTHKRWITDDDPCPICETNGDQGVIGLNEDFENGSDAPPAHPNCECDVEPIVRE